MLNVLDLHTYYGDSHILQGVTLTVERGTVTAILGRNGVGKTTLCRSLAGLTPARSGRIVFNGSEITRLPPHTICRMRVSLVPQGRRIFSSLTVEENLAIAARPHTDAGNWEPRATTLAAMTTSRAARRTLGIPRVAVRVDSL